MDNSRIVYTTRHNVPPEVEITALAAVYQFVLQRKKATPSPASNSDDAVATNEEGVSHVDQRLN
jgi:hypothetical protein